MSTPMTENFTKGDLVQHSEGWTGIIDLVLPGKHPSEPIVYAVRDPESCLRYTTAINLSIHSREED